MAPLPLSPLLSCELPEGCLWIWLVHGFISSMWPQQGLSGNVGIETSGLMEPAGSWALESPGVIQWEVKPFSANFPSVTESTATSPQPLTLTLLGMFPAWL